LSLAQLFIVNWWKNVFTLHRYNNNYMFRLLTLAIIRFHSNLVIEHNGDAEPYDPSCTFLIILF